MDKKHIHFITYANRTFEIAKQRLLQEAKEFGEFTTIQGYGPDDLSDEFKTKHENILLLPPRGGGYWIWRSEILKDAISKIEEGDYLVYLDAGCKLNPLGKKRFFEYIELLSKSEYGVLSFQMSGGPGAGNLAPEKKWTIKEIFDYFKIEPDSDIGNSGQYLGGVLILKKNKHLKDYLERFSKCIDEQALLCTDIYNSKNQATYFKENRHEQSITSILRKIMGSVVIEGDETWLPPFGKGLSLEYPFWATRQKY